MHRKKSSRSVAFQVKWQVGDREFLRQVHGDVQRKRLESTLAALPWVNRFEFVQLRR